MLELINLASRDKMFLSFVNKIIFNYNATSRSQYKTVSNLEEFHAITTNSKGKKVPTLFRLLDKIHTMIYYKAHPVSVIPFLERMVIKGVKTQTHRESFSRGKRKEGEEGETYGKGHFRWDWRAYTLEENELAAIRMYLGIEKRVEKKVKGKYNHSFKYNHLDISLIGAYAGVTNTFLKNKSYEYLIVIKTQLGVEAFPYFTSVKNYNNKKKDLLPSDLLDFLMCLLADVSYADLSFNDYCQTLEMQGQEAVKNYDITQEAFRKVRNVFGNIKLDVLQAKVENRYNRALAKEKFGSSKK